ncbi:PTS sugar transporter subunit IIA [Anaerosolibacter sp.]|uniref:PTS sugar transporter subunit IIA n=1 Tax=Anaerosolibacter sp. TaxID=1872527 RepID=UPI0039F0863A
MTKFFFDERVVHIGLSAMDDKEVLKKMADELQYAGYVKDSFSQAIIQREKIFATGLPLEVYGVAIPHTDPHHVETEMISIATLKEPISFGVMGNPDEKVAVSIVFMLAMEDSSAQLQLLATLMCIIQDTSILKKIYEAQSPKDLVALLSTRMEVFI